MEPQIIDYYNEEPQMMKIIAEMNEELEEVQKEYEKLKKELYDDSEEEYSGIFSSELDNMLGSTKTQNVHCKKQPKQTYMKGKVTGANINTKKATSSKKNIICYKCGKQGHYANMCYVK